MSIVPSLLVAGSGSTDEIGAVRSTLNAWLVLPAAWLPATSVQPSEVTVSLLDSPPVVFVCESPLPLKSPLQAVDRPEVASEAENLLTTACLNQPPAFGV